MHCVHIQCSCKVVSAGTQMACGSLHSAEVLAAALMIAGAIVVEEDPRQHLGDEQMGKYCPLIDWGHHCQDARVQIQQKPRYRVVKRQQTDWA